MRCGHCKAERVSIEHVRACADKRTVGQEEWKPLFEREENKPFAGRSATKAPAPVTEPGVYFDGEHYYKVVQNQQGTRLYAKIWDAEWVYAPGALFDLTADMKVNATQATMFGKLWGRCVFCSRLLTDERSFSVGYGPTCAEKNGLPWGEPSKPLVSASPVRAGWSLDGSEPNHDHTDD